VTEIQDFGGVIVVVAAGLVLAVLSTKLTARLPIPSPAIFLVSTAVASELFPSLGNVLSIRDVERIGVVALILILFDGGLHVGMRRLEGSLTPVLSLGILGTLATAAAVALAAHTLLGFGWAVSWLLGAALSPTDPAVVFSILGDREVEGRSGTILEAESGVNDPAGIALMLGAVQIVSGDGTWPHAALELVLGLGVGLAFGVAAGFAIIRFVRGIPLPSPALYPLLSVGVAGALYGVTAVAHGSGFLAVFVAGIVAGDTPLRRQTEAFHKSLATLAEIVVFVALGLTIDVTAILHGGIWLDGLVLAAVLVFVVRPIVVGALLVPVRLRWGERGFVIWGGVRGAVPILLATFPLLEHLEGAPRVYGIVAVAVVLSVVVQGGTVPLAARRFRVPMEQAEFR
jgi:cell volume regulation protein A